MGPADVVVLAAPHTETQTMISVDHVNDLVVVATRGTTPWDLSYWIIDMGAFPQRVPDYCRTCYVHSAFYASFGAVKRDVYESLSSFMNANADFTPAVVGHSAGGATAYLTAFDIGHGLAHSASMTVRYLITYGAPRVGNA